MEEDLGYRRVQRAGRGSYVISLPKSWVQRIGLTRGSEIAFREQDSSAMLLIPRKIMERRKNAEEAAAKEYSIYVEKKDDPRSICRKIISLYVVSSDIIRVRFKSDQIVEDHKKAISNLVKNALLGSEIIDETADEITIKILINHQQFPVEKAIRRMSILALSAINDAVSALESMDQGLIRDVIDARNDVNRLNLYVIRQLKFGLEENLFEELGFRTPKESLGYRIVANDIKSMADSAMNIARKVTAFKKMIENQMLFLKEAVDEEAYSQILDFDSLAHRLFEDSLRDLFRRDYEHADGIISKIESSAAKEDDLIAVISSKKLDPNISSILSLILDNSRRTIEYSRNIAEVTLNRTIEEVSGQNP